ncbi:MAG TPA: hypothetical protein DCZ03_10215 [Gammaproteobacteria bacterium]|nr:hypothetical protein [Gammaproteobacteria bacterium]
MKLTKYILLLFGLLCLSPLVVGNDEWAEDPWAEEEASWWSSWRTTFSIEAGARLQDNPVLSSDFTSAESRVQLQREDIFGRFATRLQLDGVVDEVSGDLFGRVRELAVSFPIGHSLNVRMGRQILTWGTGDLLFINDLFAKDWRSFFAGRDLKYLKAPSDALKISYFTSWVNVDLVWNPEFDSDRYLTGENFSFFSPLTGTLYGAPPRLHAHAPKQDEWSWRLSQEWQNTEWALYGYRGYFKRPLGVEARSLNTNLMLVPIFPELSVFGASARRSLAQGIGWFEIGRYQSREDKNGQDPLIPNNQDRFLLGYEQELLPRFTGSVQFYLEHQRQYRSLINNSLQPQLEPEEWRQVVTLRFSYRLMQEKLRLHWFSFYSPSDQDYYLLPSVNYRFSDQLQFDSGLNLFGGSDSHTFFSQLEENSNLYGRVTWYF